MTQSPIPKVDENEEADSVPEPSWFLSPLDLPANDELAERYRRLRGPQPLPRPARIVRTASYSELIATRSPPIDLPSYWEDPQTLDTPLQRKVGHRENRAGLTAVFAGAAAAAILTGGVAGYGASRFQALFTGETVAIAASEAAVTHFGAGAESPASAKTSRKTVATALLEVTDSHGEANVPIPLLMQAEPAFAGQDMIVKISGVPQSAYLTAGKELGQTWQVRHDQLDQLGLVSNAITAERYELSVAGFEAQSGEMVTPVKELTVSVVPASAPPMTAALKPANLAQAGEPSAIPEPVATLQQALGFSTDPAEMLRDGDRKLAAGNVVEARNLYGKAFGAGLAEGALRIGQSYDPGLIAALGLNHLPPNADLAAYWYGRASQKGSSEAAEAMTRLKSAAARH